MKPINYLKKKKYGGLIILFPYFVCFISPEYILFPLNHGDYIFSL